MNKQNIVNNRGTETETNDGDSVTLNRYRDSDPAPTCRYPESDQPTWHRWNKHFNGATI